MKNATIKAITKETERIKKLYNIGIYDKEQATRILSLFAVSIAQRVEGIKDQTTLEMIKQRFIEGAPVMLGMF